MVSMRSPFQNKNMYSIHSIVETKPPEKQQNGQITNHRSQFTNHKSCTMIAVSSIQATSISKVKTRETLKQSSPPRASRRSCSAIFVLPVFPPTPTGRFRTMRRAQFVRTHSSPWLLHKSVKPSENRIRNRGVLGARGSRRRCVISGMAEMYGGDRFRTRNSSQGEVSWNPGKRLYSMRRVNSGGCLNGTSPKAVGEWGGSAARAGGEAGERLTSEGR